MHSFPEWFMLVMPVLTSPVFWLVVGALVLYLGYRVIRWFIRSVWRKASW